MAANSNSTGTGISQLDRIREWYRFFMIRLEGQRKGYEFSWLFSNLADYDERLERFSGRKLDQARVLEVGFGARPLRLITMTSMGLDAWGIDLDRPILLGSPAEFAHAFRRNGWQRALKSFVRHSFFDRGERRALAQAMSAKGWPYRLDPDRFIVGDAAEVAHPQLSSGSFDLVLSEDVFEHLPVAVLQQVLARIAGWLRPGGLAIIRPAVFTGIAGGHLVEWYPHTLGHAVERRSEPWEHLRKQRFTADTFLNKLRLADYRRYFSERFEILEEVPIDIGMGRAFLTPEVRAELSDYSEDELLSNEVLFVLRVKGDNVPQ